MPYFMHLAVLQFQLGAKLAGLTPTIHKLAQELGIGRTHQSSETVRYSDVGVHEKYGEGKIANLHDVRIAVRLVSFQHAHDKVCDRRAGPPPSLRVGVSRMGRRRNGLAHPDERHLSAERANKQQIDARVSTRAPRPPASGLAGRQRAVVRRRGTRDYAPQSCTNTVRHAAARGARVRPSARTTMAHALRMKPATGMSLPVDMAGEIGWETETRATTVAPRAEFRAIKFQRSPERGADAAARAHLGQAREWLCPVLHGLRATSPGRRARPRRCCPALATDRTTWCTVIDHPRAGLGIHGAMDELLEEIAPGYPHVERLLNSPARASVVSAERMSYFEC